MNGLFEYFLISLTAMLVITNPITTSFIFSSLIPYGSNNVIRSTAMRATLVAGSVLLLFALFGMALFNMFGITLEAFRIAGGLILFGIAVKMINKHEGEHDEKHHTSSDLDTDDIAIIPLAIPFISGPGSIATVVLLSTEAVNIWHRIIVLLAVLIAVSLAYLAMIYSHKVVDFIGHTGKKIVTKIFGLLLAVISVQFVINGIVDIYAAL